jgi:hypothetical protein
VPTVTTNFNPFVDLTVRPAYGAHTAVLTWKLLPGFEAGKLFVYRSQTGNQDWKLLNENPISGVNYFSDTGVTNDDQFAPLFYRILLELNGKSYDSPVTTTYDKLNRAEYKHVRRMMNIEFEDMTRKRQGLQVWLFTPLLEGVAAASVDAQTGQQFSTGAPRDPLRDGYGQKYVGGYHPPTATWVKFTEIGPLNVSDMEGGESTDVTQIVSARILAFPTVRRDDLIVHPESDNRYAVGETTQGYFFRGTIPIAYDIKLQRLQRSDARYRLPIPVLPKFHK